VINQLQRAHASGAKVALFGLLFVASQALIGFLLHSGNADVLLITLQLTFDADSFGQLLAGMSPEQKQALLNHFYPDFVHPVWYSLFAFYATALLFNRLNVSPRWNWILPLALFMGVLDLVENSLHLPMITGYLAISELPVMLAAACATTKWSLAVFFVLLVTILSGKLMLGGAADGDQ